MSDRVAVVTAQYIYIVATYPGPTCQQNAPQNCRKPYQRLLRGRTNTSPRKGCTIGSRYATCDAPTAGTRTTEENTTVHVLRWPRESIRLSGSRASLERTFSHRRATEDERNFIGSRADGRRRIFECFEAKQLLWQGYVLSSLLFNVFFVGAQHIGRVCANLVHLEWRWSGWKNREDWPRPKASVGHAVRRRHRCRI